MLENYSLSFVDPSVVVRQLMSRAAMFAWLCTLTLLLAITPCHAQVYKCSQAGATVFTDKPCTEVGKALAIGGASPQGAIQVDVVTQHYKVSGRSFQEVYRSLKANNPGGFLGWARWKVDYHVDRNSHGSDCSVGAVSIRMTGRILMPEWTDEKSTVDIQQYRWRQMYSGLKRHEDGHIQNGREFAILLKQRLLGMGTVPCAELDERARREYELLSANLRDRDREYDRRTQHGLRQDNPE